MTAWACKVQRMVCYEHDDDGAARLHTHIHVEGCSVDIKRLRQLAEEAGVKLTIPQQDKRASSMMSVRKAQYDKDPAGYSYLTKGKYEPKYLQGWTKTDTDTWKSGWITPELHVKRTEWVKLYQEYLPYAPLAVKPVYNQYGDITNGEFIKDRFEVIREHATKWLRKKHHNIWCPQFKNQLSCIVKSYCWNHSITIPDKWRSE